MEAGFKLDDGSRLDIRSDKPTHRAIVEHLDVEGVVREFKLTYSQTKAVSSALQGAAQDM
jgi:hypothetical protein